MIFGIFYFKIKNDIMKKSMYLFVLLIIISCTTTKKTIEVKADVSVVLLAGQSNMAGAGNYDELEESLKNRIEKISNRVSLVSNGKKIAPLSYFKNKPTEKYNFTKRFGPELLIGLTLAEKYPSKKFLLIKRSQGGTALYGAWNPNWTAEKAKAVEKSKKQNVKLYSKHLEDIHQNLNLLKEQGKTYKIIGLAWMQGENDAAREISATTYKENLKVLINSYRSEFNVKEMPFIIGQINSKYGKFREKGPQMVRTFMEEVANEDNNASIIKTSMERTWLDFPKHSDNVHYNAEGQKRLGIAFAEKLIGLLH